MLLLNSQDSQTKRGRPITGVTGKDKMVRVRIEPWLYDELTYTCRMVGISRAEAIRQGIKIWIRNIRQTKY